MPVNDYEPEPLPAEPISADVATPSMIERVARAMHEATNEPTWRWNDIPEWGRDAQRLRARAAITEIRNLTHEMEQAAAADGNKFVSTPTSVWQAACDAALAETRE